MAETYGAVYDVNGSILVQSDEARGVFRTIDIGLVPTLPPARPGVQLVSYG